jgi:hypothetical protein
MADNLYCIDASSLIRLKQDFPRKVFPTVWERVEELIRARRLIAPDEVFREVENDDVVGPWAKQNRKTFRKPSQEQIDAAKGVVSSFPNLAKPGRLGPAADPFVVGLARLEAETLSRSLLESRVKCIVVTEDRGLRHACAALGLACVSLVEVFEREGWVFR